VAGSSTADGYDAVVVGAGPNGLAAGVTLAEAGASVLVLEAADTIGGGARSRELTVPGLVHDVCSAIHPLGVASPYLSTLPLDEHGLEWRFPEIDLAHPLDGGRAGVLVRDLDATVAGLGDADGPMWRRMFRPLVERFEQVADEFLQPVLHVPRHPVDLVRFGLRALPPATLLARLLRTDEARGLLAGAAAHAFHPLSRPLTSAAGVALIAAGHHAGWPVAAGGSQSIIDAMAGLLTKLGGTIETGVRVTSLDELPPAGVTLFDTSPRALAAIAGERLPDRVRRAYTRYRYGPAAFKVDLAVEGGVPWTAEPCRRAGTVHLGGRVDEVALAELDVHRGRMPERPFVLVGQQYLCDPERSVGDVHPVWAYTHVPRGYTGDATEALIDQVDRFAPGVRDRIVARHVTTPTGFEEYNANYVGGDIATGATDPWQMLARPRLAADPYATGIPGVYLCSAATPPGAGVHGMCGHHAARRALRHLDHLA
jgi:phytoene dehydrogenase-like protein